MSDISEFLTPLGLAWIAVVCLAVYLLNRFWRFKAIKRARIWAAENGLTILESRPIEFRMHRQVPKISFEAALVTGQVASLTLQLQSSWLFGDPLVETAKVTVLRQELNRDA